MAKVDPTFHSVISLSFTNKLVKPQIHLIYISLGSFHVCLLSLCEVLHCKYLWYFDNYIKMKVMFIAIYLYSFLLSFTSDESINKNVFSFKQLTLKTLIFKKPAKEYTIFMIY